jgi:para-nitrobenzyl esterase
MKLKLLSIMLTCMACLMIQSAGAQGVRYQDSVFAGYTKTTNITYSTVFNQQMDVYQPAGDVATDRPLVILAHGGSFITTGGDRNGDSAILWLCRDLARKGYVTLSMDYRLALPQNLIFPTNGDSAISEVLEAVSDGKAIVRYFYKDVLTNGNSYRIDTNNIYVGGNSAGGVLFMQYAYIDSVNEMAANYQAMLPIIGGTLEGNSGNPGYSTNIKGVISLAGGLAQTSFMGFCSKPIVYAQGTADQVVPYFCGHPENGLVTSVDLCGLGSMAPFLTNTPYYDTLTFPGAGHVPWENGGIDFYQVDTLITGFLYKEVTNAVPTTCSGFPAGIRSVGSSMDISLFPNPANNILNIRSSEFISGIYVMDETGRIVTQASDIHSLDYQINTSGLSTGIYFVRIDNGQGQNAVVRKVIIE